MIGPILQRLLPETFMTGGPRDMIGAVIGLLTFLSALTIGLPIGMAYGVCAGRNTAIQTLAAKVLQLDLALADYGPEANSRGHAMSVIAGARRGHRGFDLGLDDP